jgi:alkaline phosphatase D
MEIFHVDLCSLPVWEQGLVAAVPGAAYAATSTSPDAGLPGDPFALGIASGGPWPDGFVTWTRLALQPLAEDGLGDC